MLIRELSDRTGVATRLLRYYEEQGLLRPRRRDNGYRDYDETSVDRVGQIRGLLDSGLTTEIIKEVLPCLATPADLYFSDPEPTFVKQVEQERDRMQARIEFLTRNKTAIDGYLAAIGASSHDDDPLQARD